MPLCPSCGMNNVEGTKFCVGCGASVGPAPSPESWRAGTDELNRQSENPTLSPLSPLSHSAPLEAPSAWDAPAAAPLSPAYPGSYAPQVAGAAGQLNYALWADRVLAALIDGALAAGVMLGLYVVLLVLTGIMSAGAGVVSQDAGGLLGCSGCCAWIILPPVSYFAMGLLNKVYWVSSRGHSIGQGVMKLKVVNEQGSLLSTGTALIRLLATVGLAFIPFVGGFLDLLWPLWDEKRQTLHDKAVGSFVIKT